MEYDSKAFERSTLLATRTKRRGFTLLEILLVIVILGMLAVVVITNLSGTQDRAAIKLTKVLVEEVIPGDISRYKADMGHYPTEEEGGLQALMKKPSDETAAAKWGGPYETKEPKDSWDHVLRYEHVPAAGDQPEGYKITSDGQDGQPNTEDDIKCQYPPEQTS
jgi:general secretion pathway protein G